MIADFPSCSVCVAKNQQHTRCAARVSDTTTNASLQCRTGKTLHCLCTASALTRRKHSFRVTDRLFSQHQRHRLVAHPNACTKRSDNPVGQLFVLHAAKRTRSKSQAAGFVCQHLYHSFADPKPFIQIRSLLVLQDSSSCHAPQPFH